MQERSAPSRTDFQAHRVLHISPGAKFRREMIVFSSNVSASPRADSVIWEISSDIFCGRDKSCRLVEA